MSKLNLKNWENKYLKAVYQNIDNTKWGIEFDQEVEKYEYNRDSYDDLSDNIKLKILKKILKEQFELMWFCIGLKKIDNSGNKNQQTAINKFLDTQFCLIENEEKIKYSVEFLGCSFYTIALGFNEFKEIDFSDIDGYLNYDILTFCLNDGSFWDKTMITDMITKIKDDFEFDGEYRNVYIENEENLNDKSRYLYLTVGTIK